MAENELADSDSDDEFGDAVEALAQPQPDVVPPNDAIVNAEEEGLDLMIVQDEDDAVDANELPNDRVPAFVHAVAQSAASSSSSRRNSNFDRSLPASHLYLGQDLEDVGGGLRLLDPNVVKEDVHLFPLAHLILMPGQQLPLQIAHPRQCSHFRRIIEHGDEFGVISLRFDDEGDQNFAPFGTLAQVVAYKSEDTDGVSLLKIKAIGRQPFKLLETRRLVDGEIMGKIQVLSEVGISRALSYAEPGSLKKFRIPPASVSVTCSVDGKFVFSRKARLKKFDKFRGSACTGWPSFVYRQYDLELVITQVKAELCRWYDVSSVDTLAQSPSELSFWIASHLPLDDEMKIRLLGIRCALQRLRSELSLMKRCTIICCKSCQQTIGRNSDVFSMSAEGPMNAYVNPHGCIHETLTLLSAKGIRTRGRPSTDSSWFPGYAWTICECTCGAHVGWQFTPAKRGLTPAKFWGISRSSIVTTIERCEPSASSGAASTGQHENGESDNPAESHEFLIL